MDAPVQDGPIELGAPGQRPPRRPWAQVVAVLAAVAMVAAVALWRPDGGVDMAVEETTTTTRAPDVDRDSFPVPIALGGPRDGKESIGLPVKAEPASELADGQEVTVTGTGFPPHVEVGVVMCTREAGQDHGARGVEACNIGHFAQTTSDGDGTAVATFSVRRLVLLDGQEVDCASEAERCLLGMGMISDYDVSGGVAVDFDPDAAIPDPPTVTVDPTTDLRDGHQVEVVVTGLVPGSSAGVTQCTVDQQACWDSAVQVVVDERGTATLPTTLWRSFAGWNPATSANVDCAAEACGLQVWGEAPGGRAVPAVPLSFAGGPLERVPPTVEEVSSGPYSPGDRIELRIRGLDGAGGAEVLLCGSASCFGGMTQSEVDGDTVVAQLTVTDLPHDDQTCASDDCTIVVRAWPAAGPGGPPLLVPAPIPVTIER